VNAPPASARDLAALDEGWLAAWPAALASWSRFTRLRPPTLCRSRADAKREGLTGSFAMIRLSDQAVVVSLPEVAALGLEPYAHEVLAHEIGHHVLAPATLTDHGRMIARMRWGLPTLEKQAPMVANLYTDLLINDRLQRSAGLRMADVYRALSRGEGGSAAWAVYLRMYEILWSLTRGSLGGGGTSDRQEGDAWLGARLVRSYARDFLEGSGRFAALLLPYLLEDQKSLAMLERLHDTRDAGRDAEPAGLSEADPGEREGAVHPATEGEWDESKPDEGQIAPPEAAPREAPYNGPAGGQTRQPFEYGEILRAAGLQLSDHEIAIRYYRERAVPHLVPFPTRLAPRGTDPLPEGLEPWEIGDPLDAADWLQSVLVSPRVVPGVTTVQRVWGVCDGSSPKPEPLDLDIYVDSSGSMVDPRRLLSFPALAGAIVCLSALRAGARVQATLWSGKNQFTSTPGFVRDEHAVLEVLTGHFGGGTAFPLHRLRDTYARRGPLDRPAHILIVSDDGVSTIYDKDERGTDGLSVCAAALARARGGGTMVLALHDQWETSSRSADDPYDRIRRARDVQGWNVSAVTSWEGLVAFARAFSKLRYGGREAHG
jgi:hypothetical protein